MNFDEPNHSDIGNGLVIAYVATVAAVGALAGLGLLPAQTALFTFLGLFLLVFAGDMLLKFMSAPENRPGERSVAVSDGGEPES